MKRRKLALCLAAVMTLGLAACGNQGAEAGNTQTAESTESSSEADTGAADLSTEGITDAVATMPPADMQIDPEFGVDPDDSRDNSADDTVSADGKKLTTPYFSVTIPEEWEDQVAWGAYENENVYSLDFTDKECEANGEGGNLCSIQVSADPPEFIRYVGGDFVCGLKKTGEDTVAEYIGVSYPTDVQYGEKTQESYMKLYDEAQKIKDSIEAAEGYEKVEMTYTEAFADVESTEDGIILDAAMHSFTMQTRSGDIFTFSGEDLNTSGVEGGIQLGHCYALTYKGLIGDDGDTSGASFVSLKNIDDTLPEKNFNAMYTASQVVLAFQMKSMDALAGLCSFPLTLDDKTVKTKEELSSMDFDTAFSQDLQRNIHYCDLVDAEIDGDTFSISLIGQAPEVVISKDKDADTWSVTAIHN